MKEADDTWKIDEGQKGLEKFPGETQDFSGSANDKIAFATNSDFLGATRDKTVPSIYRIERM